MMGDTEIRRTVRVVFYAVERVREAYTAPELKPQVKANLERVGERLWTLQSDLLAEDLDRRTEKLTDSARQLRKLGKALRPHSRVAREAAEATADAADAVDALAKITDLAVEAGLLG